MLVLKRGSLHGPGDMVVNFAQSIAGVRALWSWCLQTLWLEWSSCAFDVAAGLLVLDSRTTEFSSHYRVLQNTIDVSPGLRTPVSKTETSLRLALPCGAFA